MTYLGMGMVVGATQGHSNRKSKSLRLSFDGVDDYVGVGKSLAVATGSYTIITKLVMPSVIPSSFDLWAEDDQVSQKNVALKYVSGSWVIQYYQNDTNGTGAEIKSSAVLINAGEIITIALRHDKSENRFTLFHNGAVIAAAQPTNYNRPDNAQHMLFRRRTFYSAGELISHTAYNTALGGAEVAAYNPEVVSGSYVVTHYNIAAQSGTSNVLVDNVGSNNATIYGATWKEL